MTCGRVAVQINASHWLENSSQLHQARCHHGKISQHVILAQEQTEGLHSLRDFTPAFYCLLVCQSSFLVPSPRILKGFDLRSRARAVLLSTQDVIILATL